MDGLNLIKILLLTNTSLWIMLYITYKRECTLGQFTVDFYREDGIYELRSKTGTDIDRILYFFEENRIIIATNGFVKKQQKTPKAEIELAKKRRMYYFSRKELRL